MPDFMPGIHVFETCCKDVHGRNKSGHDGVGLLKQFRKFRPQLGA
jgi:hypothetical protein